MTSSELGSFLRAHRARLHPDDVSLVSYGRRRVAGLRREEVAVLAGMNADYYARLEQGRERRPSPQILDSLCRALHLDDDARDHLYQLAGSVPDGGGPQPHESASPALRQLLDAFPDTPAFVIDPAMDLLAANPLADELFSPFQRADNLARMTFRDPAARQFFVHWHRAAEATVAALRQATGLTPHYPRLRAVVADLTATSEEFISLWRAQTVHGKTHSAKELLHPEVGPLSLTYQSFDVRGAPGQQLLIYHAEPGSPSADALTLLGTLAATPLTPPPGHKPPAGQPAPSGSSAPPSDRRAPRRG
ncbi:helix-turn-helix transcriptional regulator [Streptomyces noboritoensis]|uniref:Helix-turn-helix transcriptional regulator n=1 Tax=Streptomyces noboritoensis TaxID=67337 RepID=A0ABV6TAS5_9ACTN